MSAETVEIPDLPAFRPGATRRAVWRGLFRNAFLTVGWLLVGVFVLNIVGPLATSLLGRQSQLSHVVNLGWRVAHPEFVDRGGSSAAGIITRTSGIKAVPLEAQGVGPVADVRLHEGIFGGVGGSDLNPSSPAEGVLRVFGQFTGDVPALRAAEVKEFRQLPAGVEVAAVVEFAEPLTEADYSAFLDTLGHDQLALNPVLLSAAKTFEQQLAGGGPIVRGVYGWRKVLNTNALDSTVAGFRRWVGSLHDSDRDALAEVGVNLTDLRAAARDGRIHGVIVTSQSPAELLKMLGDRRVLAVHPYDIQFAVEGSN